MTLPTDKTQVENKPLDITALHRRINAKIAQKKVGEAVSLGQLSQLTGIDKAKLMYWKKNGILAPLPAQKGKRSVDQYPTIELEKALLAQELENQGWKPERIAGAIPFWSQQITDPAIIPQSELDQVGRAIRTLKARLLALVAKMTAQLSHTPRRCVLLAYPLPPSEYPPTPNTILIADIDRQYVEFLTHQNTSTVGISSEIGEVTDHTRDPQNIEPQIKKSNFLVIRLRGEHPDQSYGLIYGYQEDPQLPLLRRTFLEGNTFKAEQRDDWKLLLLLFDMLCTRMDRFALELAAQSIAITSQINVLVNLIPLIRPDKWDFASFLTPMNNEALKVLFGSSNCPQSLKDHLYPLNSNAGTNLSSAGWVFVHNDYLTIENIAPSDPRLVGINNDAIQALAILPAIVEENAVGVVMIGSQRKLKTGDSCFDDEEIRFLHIVARILAEIYKREQLSQPESILLYLPEPPPPIQNEEDLKGALYNVVDRLVAQARRNLNMDDSIVLLAIHLTGYGRLMTMSTIASEWLKKQFYRNLDQQLKGITKDDWESPFPSKVFMLADDQYVALLGRTKLSKQETRELRQMISEKIDRLGHLISPSQVEIQIRLWTIQFFYRDLAQQFNLANLKDGAPINKTVLHVLERTKGALKVVDNIYQGDAFLHQRNFPVALTEYQTAEALDRDNPYIARHICECLTEMGMHDEAIKYGKKAVEIDESYAGSYRRLAEVYVRKGDFDDAIQNYQQALTRAGKDPIIYLKIAQALILQSSLNDFDTIIETINQAMGYDQPDKKTRAMYLRYKGDACMAYQKYLLAASWYEQALMFDPENKELEWELSKARYFQQLNKLGAS